MKERLVELLDDFYYSIESITRDDIKDIADYLIANGVIVPPLNIGQELWDIHYNKPRKWKVVYLGYNGKEWHINIHWWKDRHNFKTLSITYPFVGKMWYLSKEEAEQKLVNYKSSKNDVERKENKKNEKV